jgi:hypothetical protein
LRNWLARHAIEDPTQPVTRKQLVGVDLIFSDDVPAGVGARRPGCRCVLLGLRLRMQDDSISGDDATRGVAAILEPCEEHARR